MKNFSYKQYFRNYAIAAALLLAAFLILIYSVKLSRNSWVNGLRASVEKVLNENGDVWLVGDTIEISSPMTTNAAAYNIINKQTKEVSEAVILRVTTLYGPLACVFTCDENNNVEFAGFSSLHGRIATQFRDKSFDQRIEYWQRKVPSILGK
ncbi:MAG: hypothetical protein MJ179_00310 [Treponema sp.]|nr:hypothetical protein [Treponema sp.]